MTLINIETPTLSSSGITIEPEHVLHEVSLHEIAKQAESKQSDLQSSREYVKICAAELGSSQR